jgi:hypothetical protein
MYSLAHIKGQTLVVRPARPGEIAPVPATRTPQEWRIRLNTQKDAVQPFKSVGRGWK